MGHARREHPAPAGHHRYRDRGRALRRRDDRDLRGADLGRARLADPVERLPESYDVDDILPSIRGSLPFEGNLYAAPFYGESAFTMYRTDLFEDAGLEMPEEPTWDFIRTAASTISKQNATSMASACGASRAGARTSR